MELTVVILFVFTFLAAYAWGRRLGRRQGWAEGSALTRLRIREESLVAGRCVICRRGPPARRFIKSVALQRIGERRGEAAAPFCISRKYGPERQNMKGGE